MKTKKTTTILAIAATLCLLACSSPERDGMSLANEINKCNASYLENVQKAESDFVAEFKEINYQTRFEAKQDYKNILMELNSTYQKAIKEVSELETEMRKKYADNYKQKVKFDAALSSGINQDLEDKAKALSMAEEIPEPVMAKVRTVIPSKPNILQIQKDLVGHSLSEGVDDGYYSSGWRWVLKNGEISNFRIESILSDTPKEYLFVANMRLTNEVGKSFDAKVKVRYVLPQNDDWTIEFVQSLGLSIVKTQVYNNCIRTDLDSYWSVLRIENNCDTALEVGLKIFKYNEWKKISVIVNPHNSESLYSVNDFRIGYVSIP